MPTHDQQLKIAATSILRAIHGTVIPLQLLAAAAIKKGQTEVIELRTQDNVPLDFELYMAANQLYNAAVGILMSLESDDESVKRAKNAFGQPPADNRNDTTLMGGWMMSNVERALRVLVPDYPFAAFRRSERPPNK